MSRVQSLKAQGFDLSYNIRFQPQWHVQCSQCAALVINGIPCHEHGCPNKPKDAEEPEHEEDDLDFGE